MFENEKEALDYLVEKGRITKPDGVVEEYIEHKNKDERQRQ